MKHILFLLPLQLTLALLQPPVQAQSPADMLGGGNISMHRLEQAEDQLKLLRQLGCGMCRFPISPTDYRPDTNGDVPVERLDTLVLLAHRHGIEPMLLFEYYTKSHGEIGSYEDWFQTGQAFAQRFGPNSEWLKSQGIGQWGIRFYSAINEPMWKDNNPREIVVKNYVQAMEGLADGVHKVNPLLRVSPGGFQEIPLIKKNPYGPAIARLYNEGKLHAIDIHRYYDVQHQPMAGTYRNSLQNQFDRVKKAWGIKTNIHFYTTEFNFKKRQITEEEAAKGFLTAMWDALGVTGNHGLPVTEFALPWNIFHLETRDENYGLRKTKQGWTPNARGKVLEMVCDLTKGMRFTSLAPKITGEYVLQGENEVLLVWQNRTGWTNHLGTEFTIQNLPRDTQTIQIFGWDGLRRTLDVKNQSSITIEGLQKEETHMFLMGK